LRIRAASNSTDGTIAMAEVVFMQTIIAAAGRGAVAQSD
jgi:hypothetical protein